MSSESDSKQVRDPHLDVMPASAPMAPEPGRRSRASSTTSRPSPSQADRLVSSAAPHSATGQGGPAEPSNASGLAVQPTLDLGDQLLGSRSTAPLHVFNLDRRLGAVLQVKLVGHPSIQLVDAPPQLRPLGDRYAPNPIMIAFAPTTDQVVASTAIIRVGWQMNERPVEEIRVAILGVAHAAGRPTHAERVATAEASRKRAADEQAAAAARAAVDARVKDDEQRRVHRYGDGAKDRLGRAREAVAATMLDLTSKRHLGVTEASTNIGEFKRNKPVPEQPSLIERLAFAALDAATGGLAKVVSDQMRAPIKRLLTTSSPGGGERAPVVREPSKEFLDFTVESVKGLVKKGGAAVVGQVTAHKQPASTHTAGSTSIDAKASFITAQADAFVGNAHAMAQTSSTFLYNSLLATLEVDPDAAVAAMEHANGGLVEAQKDAIKIQRDATKLCWIRYVAQSSLGTTAPPTARARGLTPNADGSDLTSMAPANHAPDEHRPMRTFDGLVDLEFTVDEIDHHEPARLVRATVRGVRRTVAEMLQQHPLLALNLPVRAAATPMKNRSAVTPITIVRDEAGNISHTDHMKLPWEQPSWLSRKAGAARGSATAQREGARKLIEDELMSKPVSKEKLVTDGES